MTIGKAVSGSAVAAKAALAKSAPRVRVPQRWLSGLLTGYYAVDDIASRKGTRIPPRLKPVLKILFPPSWPFVYQGDDY